MKALIEAYFSKEYKSAEEFPMYKFLAKFSELSGDPLLPQEEIEFSPEEVNPITIEIANQEEDKFKEEHLGPDMSRQELVDLFVDWK